MKKVYSTLLIFYLSFLSLTIQAQQSVLYPLDENFSANQSSFPNLTPLANTNNQTGNFQSVALPANFCPNGGDMTAYHFEDNAGLSFDNSDGFLDCEYTIEMVFKYDALPDLFDSPWVFVFGFQPNADNGLFFEFNPLFGTYLEIWEGNTEYQSCTYPSFNVNDWQKLSFTRTCDGMVQIYFDCTLFCTYNDANTQLFLASDVLTFFQDDPSILSAEAQPGFVRNIQLSNFAKTSEELMICCANICDDLLENCLVENYLSLSSCDMEQAGIDSLLFETANCDSLVIITTAYLPSDTTYINSVSCNLDEIGMYTEALTNQFGCDSIIFTTISFQEAPLFEYEYNTCFLEEVFSDTTQFDCDSIVITNSIYVGLDTILLPDVIISAGSSAVILGNTVNQPGLYCVTENSISNCDSTTCQSLQWLVASSEPNTPGGLFIPNAFSPNDDGNNDYFTVYGGSAVQKIETLQIYNAHGQLLFEASDFLPNEELEGWNGTFRNEKMPVGVYLFVTKVSGYGRQTWQRKGSFSLLR